MFSWSMEAARSTGRGLLDKSRESKPCEAGDLEQDLLRYEADRLRRAAVLERLRQSVARSQTEASMGFWYADMLVTHRQSKTVRYIERFARRYHEQIHQYEQQKRRQEEKDQEDDQEKQRHVTGCVDTTGKRLFDQARENIIARVTGFGHLPAPQTRDDVETYPVYAPFPELVATQTSLTSFQPLLYEYKPLRDGEVRLIRLSPSLCDRPDRPEGCCSDLGMTANDHRCPLPLDDPGVALEHHTLSENPLYSAVSYVWGRGPSEPEHNNRKLKLLIDGRILVLSAGVVAMLNALRQKGQSRYIWVDSICIDQSSNAEKAQQVRLMHQIYSQATYVTIYLVADDLSHPPHRNSYFTRRWTVQEFCLACSVVFVTVGHCRRTQSYSATDIDYIINRNFLPVRNDILEFVFHRSSLKLWDQYLHDQARVNSHAHTDPVSARPKLSWPTEASREQVLEWLRLKQGRDYYGTLSETFEELERFYDWEAFRRTPLRSRIWTMTDFTKSLSGSDQGAVLETHSLLGTRRTIASIDINSSSSFEDTLWVYQTRKCSQYHDFVYALLALAPKAHRHLEINYGLSQLELLLSVLEFTTLHEPLERTRVIGFARFLHTHLRTVDRHNVNHSLLTLSRQSLSQATSRFPQRIIISAVCRGQVETPHLPESVDTTIQSSRATCRAVLQFPPIWLNLSVDQGEHCLQPDTDLLSVGSHGQGRMIGAMDMFGFALASGPNSRLPCQGLASVGMKIGDEVWQFPFTRIALIARRHGDKVALIGRARLFKNAELPAFKDSKSGRIMPKLSVYQMINLRVSLPELVQLMFLTNVPATTWMAESDQLPRKAVAAKDSPRGDGPLTPEMFGDFFDCSSFDY